MKKMNIGVYFVLLGVTVVLCLPNGDRSLGGNGDNEKMPLGNEAGSSDTFYKSDDILLPSSHQESIHHVSDSNEPNSTDDGSMAQSSDQGSSPQVADSNGPNPTGDGSIAQSSDQGSSSHDAELNVPQQTDKGIAFDKHSDDHFDEHSDENFSNDQIDREMMKRARDTKQKENDRRRTAPEVTADEEKKNGVIKGDPGEHVDHGDIMFRECEEENIFGNGGNMNNTRCKKQKREQASDAMRNTAKRWSMPVAYQIISNLGSSARTAISRAIGEIMTKTCIKFRTRQSTDKDYISFIKGIGCWSYVGRSGGKQDISIGLRCEHKSTAVHEIMHALGFWHEQSRPDRDNFVTINWGNIQSGRSHNFQKRLPSQVNYFGSPYDYQSVMHYSKTAFGKIYTTGWWFGRKQKRRETITPKINTVLGQCLTCGLSQQDAFQLNKMYCSAPINVIYKNSLSNEVLQWMAANSGETNERFRFTLRTHLNVKYPNYYFVVTAYSPVSGFDKHTLYYRISSCVYHWRKYGRNLVVCFSKKTARKPNNRGSIALAVKKSIERTTCYAKTAAIAAYNKAASYGYPIAAVHVVRYGSGLTSAWTGNTNFYNYACSSTGWASLIIMFGHA